MKKKRKPPLAVFKEYNQEQMWLLPPSLDELIPKNHVVRTINMAIDGMNLSYIFKLYKGGGTSSYHPQMLLKILIYAYTQKIYSSRNIAKALRENIHFMWLSGNNHPDFRTINRFRVKILRNNIENVFGAVVELLVEKGLIKFENYFVDGTKIEADANKYSFVWGKSTKKFKNRLQSQIHDLLEHIEEINESEKTQYGDRDLEELGENSEITTADLEKTIKKINESFGKTDNPKEEETKKELRKIEDDYLPRLKKYEKYEKILGKRNSFSKTDHDATFMRMKEDHMLNGQLKAGYNVQIGTENQFILGYSIHQKPTDTTTFIPHMEKLKERTGLIPDNIIGDAGYGSEENYIYLEKNNIGNYMKFNYFHAEKKRKYRENPFRVENLEYKTEDDQYICPAGKRLSFSDTRKRISENGYEQFYRVYVCEECRWCRSRKLCHKSKYNRKIEINEKLNMLKKQARDNLNSEKGLSLRSKRPVEVESVFGQIKHNRNFRRFLLRGIEKVTTEWGLISIAHNFLKMNTVMT